ncbi:hypothetical protein KKG63_01215 [Patescibacteria group bacterium]|nr:hypothetical protein [Patescibacteria group bacterium]
MFLAAALAAFFALVLAAFLAASERAAARSASVIFVFVAIFSFFSLIFGFLIHESVDADLHHPQRSR